jgi:hypothetical protein
VVLIEKSVPNGTKASAAGLSGLRAIAQKGENRRRRVVGDGVGHFLATAIKYSGVDVNNGHSGACFTCKLSSEG